MCVVINVFTQRCTMAAIGMQPWKNALVLLKSALIKRCFSKSIRYLSCYSSLQRFVLVHHAIPRSKVSLLSHKSAARHLWKERSYSTNQSVINLIGESTCCFRNDTVSSLESLLSSPFWNKYNVRSTVFNKHTVFARHLQ